MSQHSPEHEALLERLFLGEQSRDDSAARQVLAQCPECRVRWEELDHLTRSLDAAGEEEHVVLRQASSADSQDRVGRTIRGIARELPPRGPSRIAPWPIMVVLAAGVILAISAWSWWEPEGDPPAEVFLGPQTIVCTSPVGEVESFAPFQWQGERLASGWYQLKIQGASPQSDFEWIEDRLSEPAWNPSDELLSRLPTSIWWEVRRFDDSSQLVSSGSGQARRKNP